MSDRVLLPDSNVARHTKKFLELVRVANAKRVPVVVPAQVYLETRRYRRTLKEERGELFDARTFDSIFVSSGEPRFAFADFGALVVDLERAARWSDVLSSRYQTDVTWQNVKRHALHASVTDAPALSKRNVPITADWWIALSIEELAEGFVVTEDNGPEWTVLRDAGRVFSYEDAMTWLRTLPDQHAAE
jgi:hypothetical protein